MNAANYDTLLGQHGLQPVAGQVENVENEGRVLVAGTTAAGFHDVLDVEQFCQPVGDP